LKQSLHFDTHVVASDIINCERNAKNKASTLKMKQPAIRDNVLRSSCR